MDAWAYPLCILAFLTFFSLFFREQIRGFLNRAEKISKDGIEAGKIINQLAESNENSDAIKSLTNSKISNAEQFIRQYETAMVLQKEVEIEEFLTEKEVAPQDREKTLLRMSAIVTVGLDFQLVYKDIFGSQLELLELINTYQGGITFEQASHEYEIAKGRFPEIYDDFSVEVWLRFLTSNELMTIDDGNKMQITVKGREFLIWLVNMGYTKQKRF